MARSLLVVAVMPKERRDCAIWAHDMVSFLIRTSLRIIADYRRTLLVAPRLKTISLCTFRLFNRLFK